MKVTEILLAGLLVYLAKAPLDSEVQACVAWIDKLWQRLNSSSQRAWRGFGKVLRQTSTQTVALLDRILGIRLFSFEAALVTLAWCAIPFELLNAWFFFHEDSARAAMGNLFRAGAILLLGIVPVLARARKAMVWLTGTFGWFICSLLVFYGTAPSGPTLWIVIGTFFAGAVFDFVWLTLLRTGLRRALFHERLLPDATILLFSGLIITGLFFFTPGLTNTSVIKWYIHQWHLSAAGIFALFILGSTRIFIATLAIVHLAVLGVSLLRGVICHTLARLVHAAGQSDLIKERKGFVPLAGVLLAHAFGGVGLIVEAIKALTQK